MALEDRVVGGPRVLPRLGRAQAERLPGWGGEHRPAVAARPEVRFARAQLKAPFNRVPRIVYSQVQVVALRPGRVGPARAPVATPLARGDAGPPVPGPRV